MFEKVTFKTRGCDCIDSPHLLEAVNQKKPFSLRYNFNIDSFDIVECAHTERKEYVTTTWEKYRNIMKISNQITDGERAYLNNLIVSGAGELPNAEGKVSGEATHRLIVEKGFIVGAEKIIRQAIDKKKK